MCSAKTLLKGWKGKLHAGRKYLQTIHLANGQYLNYVPKKKSYQNSTVKKNPIGKWAKDMQKHFNEEDLPMANKHMRTYSTSVAIREMYIKIKMRHHYSPIRMAKIKKQWQHQMLVTTQRNRILIHCWWEFKMIQSLCKNTWIIS